VETAVEAMRLGAFDYLSKPFELPDLKRTIEQALGQKPGTSQSQPTAPASASTKIIGQSNAIEKILGTINHVADNDSPILLEGEFGVGKQLIARALHEASRRSSAPFKAIQCSALPEDLLEAELFGHGNPQSSVFARTRGGTVHLAEIHHLPMRIQAQLNALLEQVTTGSSAGYNGGFNCRLITSTTLHLEDVIREGKFREDLYYKISVVPIGIPPLRERREDIALLVEHFLREQALRSGGTMKKMERYAEEFLEKYPWPGNISELRNAVERACALSETNNIKPADLPSKVTQKVEAPVDPAALSSGTQKLPIGSTLDDFIRGQEKMFINETLKFNNGSREKTASMLGVSIATLYRKMELNVERRTTS
jgi:DNA-binding NtrC family response regulator